MPTRIAFITSREMPDLYEDDQLVLPFLPASFEAHSLPWDSQEVDWTIFDAVVLRGCWDYHRRLPEFLAWLQHCETQSVRLFNSAAQVRWNLDKHYLQTMQNAGIAVPETIWLEPGQNVSVADLPAAKNWPLAVAKPAVSLGAWNTWVLRPENAESDAARLNELLHEGNSMLLQRFLPEIEQEGEWSLLFFGGQFSHAVLKRPAPGDFRVQHIHGGSVAAAQAPNWMIETAEKIIVKLPETPLYARVDGICRDRHFILMELELIEPVLFLKQGHGAAQKWGSALAKLA